MGGDIAHEDSRGTPRTVGPSAVLSEGELDYIDLTGIDDRGEAGNEPVL